MSERFAAWHFDGRTAEAHAAALRIDGTALVVESAGLAGALRVPIGDARISEPFANAPRIVCTGAGETFEVADGAGFTRAIEAAGFPASPVVRLQRFGPAVAVALGVLVASLVFAYFEGVPAAARWAAGATPRAVQGQLGEEVLELLDEMFFVPTSLSEEERTAIETRFAAAAELAAPAHRVRLEFRGFRGDSVHEGEAVAPETDDPLEDPEEEEEPDRMINALSLPGGTIVLLDGLVETADSNQVFAVLGHELGHIVHEHTMQSFFQSAGIAALAGLAWGDFSGVAASVPATLGLLRYDRALEREADDFAVRFLTIERLDAEVLCGFFELILALESGETSDDDFPELLSTHPDMRKRIARLCPDW